MTHTTSTHMILPGMAASRTPIYTSTPPSPTATRIFRIFIIGIEPSAFVRAFYGKITPF
jgi:hypothetical protein